MKYRTSDLNIYKSAQALVALSIRVIPDMNRAYRDSVGRSIRNDSKRILIEIGYANLHRGDERIRRIDQILELAKSVSIEFEAATSVRVISREFWGEAIQIIDGIERQAGAWKKHTKNAPDALGSRLQ